MILQSNTCSSALANTRCFAVLGQLTPNNQKEASQMYLHLCASNYERHKAFCSPSCLLWNSHLHLTLYKNKPDCSNIVTDKYGKNLKIILCSVRNERNC